MQPEAVNLEKAGRDSGKAFQDDSHHNYMARKIDLQRKQFGLVVPPDPRTLEGTVANERPRKAVAEVHFAPDVQDPSEKKAKKRKRKKIGLDSVLRRLKRRHGKVKGSSKSFTKLKEDVTQSSHAKTDPPPQAASHPQSHSKAEPDAKTLHQLETRPAMDKVGNHKYSPTKQARPDLFFTGVFILVNGYTNPDTETLQRLMHKHGGDLDKYETSRVTHIIAEHLSTAKANIYKRQKKPTPVCNPNWVVDCVRAQRLLPHAEYLIKEVRGGDIGIATYFKDDYVSDSIDHHNTLVSSFQEQVGDCLKIPPSSPPRWEPIKSDAKTDKIDTVANAVVSPVRRATSSSTDTPSAPIEDQNAVSLAQKLSSPSSRTDEKCIDGRIRTTGTDPNFLESFFDQSRLSFIGSYKQRARQTTQKKVSRRKGDHRFVFHVDMDCFFASVVLRSFPEYRDRPVAISHQGKKRLVDGSTKVSPVFFKGSTSECATCNYTARGFGVKKGMYLGRAKELCPDLVVLQYDFEGYEEVSEQVTDILYQHAEDWHGVIEQVSCDEAYMEIYVAGDSGRRPEDVASELAENIRKGVFDATQCTATVGVAPNRLLAKLATDRVKPNRSFVVDDYRELIRDLHLRNLHGIGHRSEKKLVNEGLVTVQDIWDLDKQAEGELCRILGTGLGKKILDACYGRDERPVEAAERKTIGAEVRQLGFSGKTVTSVELVISRNLSRFAV
jgi:DNA repair protein REV1